MTKIEDKSLLICTWNKSVDIFKKVLLVVSVVVVSLLGLVIIVKGLELFWTYQRADVYYWLEIIISTPLAFLISIPWYVYVGAVAVLAIPVYSFLWCIARELTEEDWGSKEAANIFTISIFTISIFAISIVLAISIFAIANISTFGIANISAIANISTFGIASALVSIPIIPIIFTITPDNKTDNKIFFFPGAYLHYRRRMKSQEITE